MLTDKLPFDALPLNLLLGPAAALINRGIEENDNAKALCDALDERALRILAKPLSQSVLLACRDGQLELSTDDQRVADVEIAGSLIELCRLTFFDSEAPLREGHVEIAGDAEIADQFRELLITARPDLEAKLTGWFGAETAGRMTDFARETRERAADIKNDWTERAADYLHESDDGLPGKEQIAAHFNEVDEFTHAVERLAARLERLSRDSSA